MDEALEAAQIASSLFRHFAQQHYNGEVVRGLPSTQGAALTDMAVVQFEDALYKALKNWFRQPNPQFNGE